MGGHIHVKTEPGKGSNFSFSIPLTPSLKPPRTHAREENMNCLEERNILIVDDNSTQRNILLKQMQTWRIRPFFATSAEHARGILSQDTKIDLVLVDSHMPDVSDIQLAKSIKSGTPSMPIILMNAGDNENYRQNQELFAHILSKPIRQNLLRDCLLDIFLAANVDKPAKEKKLTEDFAMLYPMQILIAEDNIVNQKLATKMLTKLGYKPELAKNGKEVVEMIGQEHYDIILMDVQMPEMDGLEATRLIRTCLDVQPVIIAVTANVMMGDRDECMQAGMDDYISKPIELTELLDRFEKWYHAIKNRRKLSA